MNAAEKERHEEARWLSQRTTARSEQSRAAYGSLLISVQDVRGLCSRPKCCKKEGHAGTCWPS